jgi:hypothetical protein
MYDYTLAVQLSDGSEPSEQVKAVSALYQQNHLFTLWAKRRTFWENLFDRNYPQVVNLRVLRDGIIIVNETLTKEKKRITGVDHYDWKDVDYVDVRSSVDLFLTQNRHVFSLLWPQSFTARAEFINAWKMHQAKGDIPSNVGLMYEAVPVPKEEKKPGFIANVGGFLGGVFALLVLIGLGIKGFNAVMGSHIGEGAKCHWLSTMQIDAHIFVDQNGDPDAGYVIGANVENQGQDGDITVTARLTDSEGQWTKKRVLRLGNKERQHVSVDFPEPTINSRDASGKIECAPS